MTDVDRLKLAVMRIVRALLYRLDYSCFYAATVASQNGDGSLELKPTSARLPPMSRVAIRYGIPGVAVTVHPGANVLVGFAGQDPSSPYALVQSGLGSIQALSLLGGNQPIARVGDVGSVVWELGEVPFTGVIGGLPAVGVITVPPTSSPVVIATGNPNVTA